MRSLGARHDLVTEQQQLKKYIYKLQYSQITQKTYFLVILSYSFANAEGRGGTVIYLCIKFCHDQYKYCCINYSIGIHPFFMLSVGYSFFGGYSFTKLFILKYFLFTNTII